MKKILYIINLVFLLASIEACTGYKPIFDASKVAFKINDYSLSGDRNLGNKIYYKLYNFSRSNENSTGSKDIYLKINTNKNKNATSKNSAGKVIEYRISLSAQIIIKDLSTGNEILNETFSESSLYKVQDQFSETIKLENKSMENLINTIYQNLLIKLSENIIYK